MQRVKRLLFKTTGRAPTIPYMLSFGLKLIFQIIFHTIFTFMILWMTLFHKRWENFRNFLTRNYSQNSVIYLGGFLMISSFTLTTLGRSFKPFLSGINRPDIFRSDGLNSQQTGGSEGKNSHSHRNVTTLVSLTIFLRDIMKNLRFRNFFLLNF